MYRAGLGVNYNAELAEECFRKAIKQGNTDAMVNLAQMQQSGEIVSMPEEAREWLEIAAKKRNIKAMRLLHEQKKEAFKERKSRRIKGILTAIVVISILPWTVFINSLLLPLFASMGAHSIRLEALIPISILPAALLLHLIHRE